MSFNSRPPAPDSPEAGLHAPPPRNLAGAIWMLGSAVCFTLMGLMIKLTDGRYDPAFLAFVRVALGFVLMAPWIVRAGPKAWASNSPIKLLWRSFWGTIGFVLSFYAFSLLPLAEANAISFSRTLFIVPLAYFVLREPVGPRRWLASGVGFIGVLVMLKPGTGLTAGSLAALASALAFAISIVSVKDMTRNHSPLTLLLYANLLTALMMAPFLPFVGKMPPLHDWPLMFALAAAGLGAQACYIKGLSIGEASVLSAVDYLRLPMTSIADFLLHHIVPSVSTLLGALIVIASTLYITLREARLNVRRPEGKTPGPG